jgi:serine/threonine protein phosphatase PrpC
VRKRVREADGSAPLDATTTAAGRRVISQTLIAATAFAPQALECPGFEVVACTHASPYHPERNEDAAGAWTLDDGTVVLAVADGMGGMPQGAEAAATAIRSLDRHIKGAGPSAVMRSVLLDAIEATNAEVLKKYPGAGTTLIAGKIEAGRLRTFNVGDSGVMLVGQRGRVKLETMAHSPVGYGVAAGLIDPETALEHEDRHFVSNHLGSPSMHIEIGSRCSVALRDTLLIASDGLLDNLAPNELVEVIRCGPLLKAAQILSDRCRERMKLEDSSLPGKPDDLTFLLARRRHSARGNP